MRDINLVIREKEAQVERIHEELAALRLTLRLLTEESGESSSTEGQKFGSLRDEPARVPAGRVKNFP